MNKSETKSRRIPSWLIGAVVVFVIILPAALTFLVPKFVKAAATSRANACLNHLSQIEGAANQFALEHHLTNGAPINYPDDLTTYLKLNSRGNIRECPQGGFYSIKKVGDRPTCSLGNTITPAHSLK